MAVSADSYGPTLLAVTVGLSSMSNLLPHLADVRAHTPSDVNFAADVRLGEVAAAAFILGAGAIASSLTGTMAPAVVSLAMTLAVVAIYECALQGRNLFGATDA